MIRFLITDDDESERLLIQFLLNKISSDFVLDCCSNGEQALDFISRNPVDLLITDIKMPLMDGLELSKQVHKAFPLTKIIILSAYDSFEFARQAISFSVSEYLLKPIDPAVFHETVLRVIRQIEEDRSRRRQQQLTQKKYSQAMHLAKEKLLLDLISDPNSGSSCQAQLQALGLELCTPEARLLLINVQHSFWENRLRAFGELHSDFFFALPLNPNQLMLYTTRPLPEVSDYALRVRGWLCHHEAASFQIIISSAVSCPQDFFSAYHRMESILDYTEFSDCNQILLADQFPEDLSGQQVETALPRLLAEMEAQSTENMLKQLRSILGALEKEKKFSVVYTKYYICEAVTKILQSAGVQHSDDSTRSRYLKAVLLSTDLQQISQVVDKLQSELLNIPENPPQTDHSLIQGLQRWIEQEYMHDLTLVDAAERVYLTPSYLSVLFKKETGSSFVQYLTHIRLQKSKELLLSTNRRVVEIALMVGYTNPSYFTLLFKNYFGYTPAKFRKLKGIEI